MNVNGTFAQAHISMAIEGFAMRAMKGQAAQTVELLQTMTPTPAPGSTVDVRV